MTVPEFLISGPADAGSCVLLAHGAGAPMDSPFLEQMAAALAERRLACRRFEFAYMAGRRDSGKKRPAPRAETLADEYRAAVEASRKPGQRLVIGGKSMGGRVASMVAADLARGGLIAGLVCLGYPFRPPKQPEKLRTAHLERLEVPTLIVQGERDPFGGRAEVEAMRLSAAIRFAWIGDGDHDFGPRGASGFTRRGNLAAAADAVRDFVAGLQA